MKRALGVLLLLAAPVASAADADIAKGLENLKYIFEHASLLEVRRTLTTMPEPPQAILDPWGTPYRFDIEAQRVVSAGSDREFDVASWLRSEQFTGLEGDVVWLNGNFVRTNHNWLCAQVTPGAAAQLAAMRDAEGYLLMLRTEGMRKVIGVQLTGGGMEIIGAWIEDFRRQRGSLALLAPPSDPLAVLSAAGADLLTGARDAWGTPLRVIADGEKYRIISAGADRTFQPMSWARQPGQDAAEDMIYEDGGFTRRIDEQKILEASGRKAEPIPQPPDRALRSSAQTRFEHIDKSITGPVIVNRVEPAYPEAYRRAGISGIVILELAINETGQVENYAILKSLGPALDMAALDAVRKWTFRPATRYDKPVPVLFNLTINFKLN